MKPGRQPISSECIEQIKQLIREDKLSYSQISESVYYYTKSGKKRHPSGPFISSVKKSMGLPMCTIQEAAQKKRRRR